MGLRWAAAQTCLGLHPKPQQGTSFPAPSLNCAGKSSGKSENHLFILFILFQHSFNMRFSRLFAHLNALSSGERLIAHQGNKLADLRPQRILHIPIWSLRLRRDNNTESNPFVPFYVRDHSAWLLNWQVISSPRTTQLALYKFSPEAARREITQRFVFPSMNRATASSFCAVLSRPVIKAGQYAASSLHIYPSPRG